MNDNNQLTRSDIVIFVIFFETICFFLIYLKDSQVVAEICQVIERIVNKNIPDLVRRRVMSVSSVTHYIA